MIHVKKGLAIAAAIAGMGCLISGLWIPAKAVLAQHLISGAWGEAMEGQTKPRPWPWADTWPIAKLSIPRLDKELFVLAHATGQSLAFGPAHVSRSALPGERDNVVFAGHRDTHFAFLEDLQKGDALSVETAGGQVSYRVIGAEIVHESRTEVLERSGVPELTLITCYPFDAVVPGGPLRYVVHLSLAE